MKPEKITIDGTEVSIQFVEDHGDRHVGWATHEVKTSDMEEGSASGPWDNQTFELRGKTYRLGAHDYEAIGDTTTCTARIYEEDAGE